MKRMIRSSEGSRKIIGNDWKKFLADIEERWGFEVDSVNRRRPENFITLYRNGVEYEAEVNIYHDDTYELIYNNISEVGTIE